MAATYLGIWSYDSDLPQVLQHFGPVATPAAFYGKTELCTMPVVWIWQLTAGMNVGSIPASTINKVERLDVGG